MCVGPQPSKGCGGGSILRLYVGGVARCRTELAGNSRLGLEALASALGLGLGINLWFRLEF